MTTFRITERNDKTDGLVRELYAPFSGELGAESISESIKWRETNAKALCQQGHHARLERLVSDDLSDDDQSNEWEYL